MNGNTAELCTPAILLVAVAFATIAMAVYTYAAAASGEFDLANHAIYEVQPSVIR